MKFASQSFPWLLTGSLLFASHCLADENTWQFKHILQTYLQSYSDDSDRKNSHDVGYFLSADYLDSGNLSFAYNSTFVKFENNADDSGEYFYLSGQKHLYPDSLAGKLSLRLDTYFGEESLKFRENSAATVPGPGNSQRKAIPLGAGIVAETTDIDVYYLDLSLIDYDKTFYGDIGFAHSEYDGSALTEVEQITPSFGFGWNESYDWLQLRAYLIDIDQPESSFDDDKYESIEAKYTHWFAGDGQTKLEFVRLTALFGERILAVDPDAAVIYSIADIQKTSLSGSLQWQLSANTKTLALIQYDQYEDANQNDYDSFLFYINFQFYQQ